MGLYFQGLTMGLAYVAPIGMQNLFVINSALTRTRRNALITAAIVIFFDIVLSLACFFGIGALMQAHPWLQTVVLGLGGASWCVSVWDCCCRRRSRLPRTALGPVLLLLLRLLRRRVRSMVLKPLPSVSVCVDC